MQLGLYFGLFLCCGMSLLLYLLRVLSSASSLKDAQAVLRMKKYGVTPRGSCHINEEIYKHGEIWKPEPCISCICTDGIKHCTTEQCQELDCEGIYIPNGKCCPKCRIIMKGVEHQKSDFTFGFASYYQNNMVLQMEPHSAIIWGYGTQGATVNISVNVQDIYSTKVKRGFDQRGVWSVKIKPQPTGATFYIQGVHDYFGKLQWILLNNILFGDVYVCSGQSNMLMTMGMVFNATEELKETVNYPNIRVFTVAHSFSATPQYDLIRILQPWSVPSPGTIGGKAWTYFSAVCWLYGKYLYAELKIPIGLIATTWGGTTIAPWAPPDVFKVCYESDSAAEKVLSQSQKRGFDVYLDPSHLFNAMVHPLANMTIKGVLWHQGEANVIDINLYQCMFPNLIKSWRKYWYMGTQMSTDPMFPFGFVQIGTKIKIKGNFPLVRWRQTAEYGYVPNPEMERTFMAVAMDLPDNSSPYGSVHPRHKQDVSRRLVYGALSVVYHRTSVFDGPFPDEISELKDHQILIKYSNYQQLVVHDNNNFQVCCMNQHCHVTDAEDSPRWFTAEIIDHTEHTITLNAKKCNDDFQLVDKVRYAWALTPCEFKNCSVYNTLGLPAAPFYQDVFGRKN